MFCDFEYPHRFRFLSDRLKTILEKTRIFYQCFFVFLALFFSATLSHAGDGLSSKWSFGTGAGIASSAALGTDGLIYVGSGDGNLYAFNPDGKQRMLLLTTAGQIVSSPAIDADGTIHIGSTDRYAYSVRSNGTLKWRLTTAGPVTASPAISSDGTVYVGSEDGFLYSVGSGGGLRWTVPSGAPITVSPITGNDGSVYVVSGRYLYAIRTSDGVRKWSADIKANPSSPVLDDDGTIYLATDIGYVYSMNPADGTVKKSFQTNMPVALSSPVIGNNAMLYVGSADHKLYAFDLQGKNERNWNFETDGPIASSPAIGADGNIYVISGFGTLYAVSSEGKMKQSLFIGETSASLLIGPDGTIYIGAKNGFFTAVSSYSEKGPANSPWPMFGHDMRHTGRNGTNQSPKAAAGGDSTVTEEDRVILDGSGSSDPDYGIFTYQWTQTGGITVTLENANSVTAAFSAPKIDNEQETVTFSLTVTDSHGLTASDTCTITIKRNDYTCFIGSLR